jgi:hypothetical protein
MNLTTAQVFQIGSIVGGAFAAGSNLAGFDLDAHTIAIITTAAGLFLILWNGIGAVLTGQAAQVKAVSNIEGVQVVASKKAPKDIQDMANDDSVKNVNMSPPTQVIDKK